MMVEKHIGILGLGHFSTQFYVQYLNTLAEKKWGGYSTAPFKMLGANFDHINPYLPNQYDTLKPVVDQYLSNLWKLDVSCIVVPNITLHETIDQLEWRGRIIHPVTSVISRLKVDGVTEVQLLGSYYTSVSEFVLNQFLQAGIHVLPIAQGTIDAVDELRKKVYRGEELESCKKRLNELLESFSSPSVLACTELSIIAPPSGAYDMARIQIDTAFEQTFS